MNKSFWFCLMVKISILHNASYYLFCAQNYNNNLHIKIPKTKNLAISKELWVCLIKLKQSKAESKLTLDNNWDSWNIIKEALAGLMTSKDVGMSMSQRNEMAICKFLNLSYPAIWKPRSKMSWKKPNSSTFMLTHQIIVILWEASH